MIAQLPLDSISIRFTSKYEIDKVQREYNQVESAPPTTSFTMNVNLDQNMEDAPCVPPPPPPTIATLPVVKSDRSSSPVAREPLGQDQTQSLPSTPRKSRTKKVLHKKSRDVKKSLSSTKGKQTEQVVVQGDLEIPKAEVVPAIPVALVRRPSFVEEDTIDSSGAYDGSIINEDEM